MQVAPGMLHVMGSVLGYVPDHSMTWEVEFTRTPRSEDATSWTRPILGWATVVNWTGYEEPDEEEGYANVDCRPVPVVLNDAEQMDTADIYAREAKLLTTDKVSWRLVETGGYPSTPEKAPAR
ncbi:hypothetical protein ABT332_06560 [Saccharomonospora azurea]|uniref:hypothetical protein n=1 Tax=Saccharomonospora azurea TaxID=40988 RepID=UPI003319E486